MQLHDQGVEELVRELCVSEAPLKELVLTFTFIGDIGAKHIADLIEKKPKMTTVDLESNDVGDEGARHLAKAVAGHKHMRELFLEDNLVGNVGAKALARVLQRVKEDFTLVLTNNNVGDPGALALATALEKNDKMTSFNINLTRNNVGDEGAAALQRAIKKKLDADQYAAYLPDIRLPNTSQICKYPFEGKYLHPPPPLPPAPPAAPSPGRYDLVEVEGVNLADCNVSAAFKV